MLTAWIFAKQQSVTWNCGSCTWTLRVLLLAWWVMAGLWMGICKPKLCNNGAWSCVLDRALDRCDRSCQHLHTFVWRDQQDEVHVESNALEMEMLSQTRVSSSLPSTWTPRHPCSEGSCEVCLGFIETCSPNPGISVWDSQDPIYLDCIEEYWGVCGWISDENIPFVTDVLNNRPIKLAQVPHNGICLN